jgi:branched-chain amino acid transport system permease protein
MAFWAITSLGLPYFAALGIGLASALLMGLVVERLVIRPLFASSRVTVLVATVGVALLAIQLELMFGKPEGRVLPPVVPGDFNIFDVTVTWQGLLILGVLAALAVGLAVFFRTDRGLSILATSQDPLASRIVGISVTGTSRLIWALAAVLGGVAGLLQAGIPGQFFAPGFMTSSSLLPAFTGAVLGGMTSLPGAFVGGLLVGVAQNVGIFYLGDTGLNLSGPSEITLFGLLLLVLLVRPQGILGTEA